jgi:hypothetical protein
MSYPEMIRIRQQFDSTQLMDIPSEIQAKLSCLAIEGRVKPGESVAVGCSSRGIANYDTIIRATVAGLKKMGLKPFLFPAMGSHGAATAEGQSRVLSLSGISEKTMGAPVRSSLDTQEVGRTAEGVPVLVDSLAWKADHIVLANRIKPHTEFTHNFESGVLKMLAIGLGKEKGAKLYHKAFISHGYGHTIGAITRVVLQSGKFLFGIAVVENGYGQTALVDVIAPDELEKRESMLLKKAYRMSPGLPFEEVDVLIIDEMGKDISGCGFDAKVVGRIGMPLISQEPQTPRVKRIVVCDLTAKTEGNADGVGCADFITERLAKKIDLNALYVNAIAGSEPEHARIPMQLPSDGKAIDAAMGSVGLIPVNRLKVIRIKNTQQLDVVEVSKAYRNEITSRNLELLDEFGEMAFDADGNLPAFEFERPGV